ncbi:D-amino acid dehydrogenase [Marinobacter mobilis]|uniref:D-amino-acid dehydrogenase n=1 Tax=Marinobacter mobilis TaxID=488533 RepID=A0A1H2Q0G9_9GAMM|nr:D-amino acid dehydrogenase [Marinobacter mobilis]SDW00009.1 D-amino-acid dehydrogenase [Marinobacter mobilis]
MHIVVIGAGVVGVTSAYALARRGHQVTVVERLEGAGLETSFGNAGQRSYGVVYPWASAAMVRQALPWLVSTDGPLKMHLPPSPATVRFLLASLRFAFAPGVYGLNKRAMLQMGVYSRQCFAELEQQLALDFDGDSRGVLQLASTPAMMAEYRKTAALLEEFGIAHRLLGPIEVRELEPGMTGDGPLHGGIHYETDGTGDCHLFSRSLAAACSDQGVAFLYGHQVERLLCDDRRVLGVRLCQPDGAAEDLAADAVVVSAGCWSPMLVADLGLQLPIYPVKGYSLTAPLLETAKAPLSTVHDDNFKVVSTRLGSRLRATGFVELSDFRRDTPQARLATIRKSVASRFPGCADLDQASSWTGFRPMTPDGPAILGRGPRDNLYLNTGHGTFGWTLSAGSAELLAQLVDGEPSAIALDAFRADRFRI